MLQLNLSKAEIKMLNYERFYYPSPIIQKRIHAVYMKSTIKATNTTIGLLTGLKRQCVSHWIRVCQIGGFDSLCQFNYGTNTSELTNVTDFASSKPDIFRPRPMLRNKKNGLKQPWSQQLKRHGKENAICYLWMRLILFYSLLFVPYGA